MSNLQYDDISTWMDTLWRALLCYRDDCISGEEYDEEWDDLCTVMAWLDEELPFARPDSLEPSLKFYRASFTTRNFDFEAFGRTKESARQALIETLDAHGIQLDLPDGWWFLNYGYKENELPSWFANMADEQVLKFGVGFRDRSMIIDSPLDISTPTSETEGDTNA